MDYEEQLDRALAETPDIEGSSSRFELPDPDARQEGHATVYENFQETVDRLDRDQELLLKYLQNELGTSAHIDERGRARFTGSFGEDRLRNAIEDFSDTFVLCSECGLPDTRIVEEQGAKVLRCEACGAISPTS